MTFIKRASGTTLRRMVERAIVDPHDARERFDPEFLLACQCQLCGEIWQARRLDISPSMHDHLETCSMKHVGIDQGSAAVRVYYPKQ